MNWFLDIAATGVQPREENRRTVSEGARIAALTWTLAAGLRFDVHEIVRCSRIPFSRLSYAAETVGTPKSGVLDLAKFCLEHSKNQESPLDTRHIALRDITGLLGEIHLLGCQGLSALTRGSGPRKPLGAFYTPSKISNFIVELTLGGVLDRIIRAIPKEGSDAIRHLLSLTVLDPACGSGAFLVSAMSALQTREERIARACAEAGFDVISVLDNHQQSVAEVFRHNLYGVDLDSASLEIAEASLSLMLCPSLLPLMTDRLDSKLKQGNSLISLGGFDGQSDNSRFFADPQSRHPFEWPQGFPEVICHSNGFDFVVMNPPYNRLKPNMSEFLREHDLPSYSAVSRTEFAEYRTRIAEDVAYFRGCGDFSMSGVNSIDSYRLFIERALSLTRASGQVGFIVPSTLLADFSAQPLRRSLITQNNVRAIYEFPEAAKVFPGVTQSVCIAIVDKGARNSSLKACFGVGSIEDAQKGELLRIPVDAIEATMGDSFVIPRVNHRGWKILRLMHANPPIANLVWLTSRRGELDLTLNKRQILQDGSGTVLIRGSQITRYMLRSSGKPDTESVDLDVFIESLGSSGRLPHIHKPRIVCQQVSNRAQRWRLKFALVPAETVLANSCNYISLATHVSKSYLLYLLGIMNSELMNWRFDLSNANNHVSNRELASLPIPDPVGSTDVNMEVVRDLIDETRRVIKEGVNYSSRIEALVFNLYSLGVEDARAVLFERRAEREQIQGVLHYLQHASVAQTP